jgi:hypothetical protein
MSLSNFVIGYLQCISKKWNRREFQFYPQHRDSNLHSKSDACLLPICTENEFYYGNSSKISRVYDRMKALYLFESIIAGCSHNIRNISIHIMVLRTHLYSSWASCLLGISLFKHCEWNCESSVYWNWLYVLLLLIVDYLCWILEVSLVYNYMLDILWKTVLYKENFTSKYQGKRALGELDMRVLWEYSTKMNLKDSMWRCGLGSSGSG